MLSSLRIILALAGTVYYVSNVILRCRMLCYFDTKINWIFGLCLSVRFMLFVFLYYSFKCNFDCDFICIPEHFICSSTSFIIVSKLQKPETFISFFHSLRYPIPGCRCLIIYIIF